MNYIPNPLHSNHITDTLVMVRPDQFGFNTQTAVTNVFQHKPTTKEKIIRDNAVAEFDNMVSILKQSDINVIALNSRTDKQTPDAVFPNNWFTHHTDGTLIIYPMLTPNRRAERQIGLLLSSLAPLHLTPHIFDFSREELRGNILEGTGSMVFDRKARVAFAIESARTTKKLFSVWCRKMQYEPFLFHAYNDTDIPIYHTNMFMSIGENFAIYCPETILDASEKIKLEKKLTNLQKELIPISLNQVFGFCGNILQVSTRSGEKKILLSETACSSFTVEQKKRLSAHGTLLAIPIPTIETVGGGSVRCMVAEIFPTL